MHHVCQEVAYPPNRSVGHVLDRAAVTDSLWLAGFHLHHLDKDMQDLATCRTRRPSSLQSLPSTFTQSLLTHPLDLLQGFIYINLDKEMQDPATKEFARARNTNLNEDLGKIEYVFSDKTGTLTSNEMQLREIAIKGVAFGTSEFKCAPVLINFFKAWDTE